MENNPNKKKKKGAKGFIIGILIGLISVFFLIIITFLPFFIIIGASFSCLEFLDKVVKKVETVITNVGSSINEILHEYGLTSGNYADLSPLPEDITESNCENCIVVDHYFDQENHIRYSDNPTKRLYAYDKDIATWSNMDWQYTGWTIDESDYWDVNYSKFSKKTPESEREYLFKWKINNYKNNITEGRQQFTFERRGIYDGTPTPLDETTRNGSFAKVAETGEEWLDLGNIRFLTFDGRIRSAFAPMVTAGDISNLLRARGWFHRGDVWTGSDTEAFQGLSLWLEDVGRGTYIDVVFENNETKNQIVIPFVYADSKNIHWFDSLGQRVDQRYGQCSGTVTKIGSNGTYEKVTNYFECEMSAFCNSYEEFIKTYPTMHYADYSNINYHTVDGKVYSQADMKVGNKFYVNTNEAVLSPLGFKLADGSIGRLTNFVPMSMSTQELMYSDDDILHYKHHTALELMKVYYDSGMKQSSNPQDINFFIAQSLFEGFHWNGTAKNFNPNWSLVCMRVYKDCKYNLNDDTTHYFTDISKRFEPTNEITNNTVIEFNCGPECTCTICQKIESR